MVSLSYHGPLNEHPSTCSAWLSSGALLLLCRGPHRMTPPSCQAARRPHIIYTNMRSILSNRPTPLTSVYAGVIVRSASTSRPGGPNKTKWDGMGRNGTGFRFSPPSVARSYLRRPKREPKWDKMGKYGTTWEKRRLNLSHRSNGITPFKSTGSSIVLSPSVRSW